MPSVSRPFRNVVTTGVSAASRDADEHVTRCFEGDWMNAQYREVVNDTNFGSGSVDGSISTAPRGCEPKWHRIQIVAPTDEELDRLRQAVELDRELLTVRRQLLELEQQRSLLASPGKGFSPQAVLARGGQACHVGDRSAALSEEHIRKYAAFDEAVLTMRRGYSLETSAVIRSMPEDSCDPLCMPSDIHSLRGQTNSSRLTPMGASSVVPPAFADHPTPASEMAATTRPSPTPDASLTAHSAVPPPAGGTSLATLPIAPTHHLDMPSPRPQHPFCSADPHSAAAADATNTAPLFGQAPPASHTGSTTSATYFPAFQLRSHRTFNSEPAPRTRRSSSSTSGHFPPVASFDRACNEASKLSRIWRSAVHCLPQDPDYAQVRGTGMLEDTHEALAAVEASVDGQRHTYCAMPISVEYSASVEHESAPLQPVTSHAAHQSPALAPDAAPPLFAGGDATAANVYQVPCACGDMHDVATHLPCGPPGSREEASGQQCLELLRGAHLRPWSVSADTVFTRVRSLAINHTTGHDYCAALAPHLEAMAGLKTLDMSNTELCAAGAAALAPRMPGLRCLQKLNLAGNRVGEAGIRVLAPVVARLPNLRHFDIRENGIPMHALHELERMLSDDVVLLC
eukprot:jgi/Ulvmu1/7742/UM039_0050.1